MEKYKEDSIIKQRDIYTGKVQIKTVNSHVYLGTVIENSGSDKLNIQSRFSKGQAMIRDIFQILEGSYFGSFYFDVVKLLRESMLISVITHNLEISFNLTEKEVKMLNDLDMQLLRGSLLLGARSSQCLILLELGLTSVSYILKRKRVLYLHHLLTTDQSSLVAAVFREQVRTTKRGDWVQTVIRDLEDLGINKSFSEIASIGKQHFKKLVKQSCENACFYQLIEEKQKLSKGKDISYSSFRTQPYLMSESGLSIETMRRIYHTKCR